MNNFLGIKVPLVCFFFWLLIVPVYGQTSFNRGEAFFVLDRPREALEFLQAAVAEDPNHVQAFLYLGIVYQQLGMVDEAIDLYQGILPRILPDGGVETARLAFNLGNAYLTKGDLHLAVQSYTQALEAVPEYPSALLNRANTYVQLHLLEPQGGFIEAAVADYENYLSLEGESSQAGQIRELISFIREEERLRQEAIAAEEQRLLAIDDADRQEAERMQRFLQEVAASAQAIAEDSRNLTTAQSHEEELELDEVYELDEVHELVEAEEFDEAQEFVEAQELVQELTPEELLRIAAEEAARQEAERRQRFLLGVAASALAIAEDSRNLSAAQVHEEEPENDYIPDLDDSVY